MTITAERTSMRHSGYLVTIVVNVALLYVVNNLLGWDIIPFLTEDFSQLLPVVNLSFAATILANVVYLTYDPEWFRSLTQLVLSGIALAVTIRTYQIFPFDFSAYEFDWTGLARLVLIATMLAVGIAILVELVRFLRLVLALEAES